MSSLSINPEFGIQIAELITSCVSSLTLRCLRFLLFNSGIRRFEDVDEDGEPSLIELI